MFYKMIEAKRDQWYRSSECTVNTLVDYMAKDGHLRDAQIDAVKTYVIRNGQKTREYWDGCITSEKKPLRLKIRNICGDETVWEIR